MPDIQKPERARVAVEGASKPLRTVTYLLRLTSDEKEVLEQRVREAAAAGKMNLTLADVLRGGAMLYLDNLREKLAAEDGGGDAVGEL
jgi:hypothetical protein